MAKAKPSYGASSAASAASADSKPLKIIQQKIRSLFVSISPIMDGDDVQSKISMIKMLKILVISLGDIKNDISDLNENETLKMGNENLLKIGIKVRNFQYLTTLEEGIKKLIEDLENFLHRKSPLYRDIEPKDINPSILNAQKKLLLEVRGEVDKAILAAMNEIAGAEQAVSAAQAEKEAEEARAAQAGPAQDEEAQAPLFALETDFGAFLDLEPMDLDLGLELPTDLDLGTDLETFLDLELPTDLGTQTDLESIASSFGKTAAERFIITDTELHKLIFAESMTVGCAPGESDTH